MQCQAAGVVARITCLQVTRITNPVKLGYSLHHIFIIRDSICDI